MPSAERQTILVAEDDESVRRVVVAILEGATFLVLSADSGSAAVKLAQETEQPIDLPKKSPSFKMAMTASFPCLDTTVSLAA